MRIGSRRKKDGMLAVPGRAWQDYFSGAFESQAASSAMVTPLAMMTAAVRMAFALMPVRYARAKPMLTQVIIQTLKP